MCTVCGCSEGNVTIEGQAHDHTHDDAHPHEHSSHEHHTHQHGHDHAHEHTHTEHDHPHSHSSSHGSLHYGHGPAGAHAPGLTQARMVQIEQDILGKNNRYAEQNRARFFRDAIFVMNLVSSPGSGKTTLLTETLKRLEGQRKMAVIEGDQQTANDADRIRETGVPAIQINTGKGCHLDAHMVGHAMEQLPDLHGGILFIENVGNLVCPAAFDLGEAHKVAILSVTEGEDKPIKYPDMFHAADVMILNKVDLLPYLDFDVEACIEYARRVNPTIEVLQVSARSGEGMEAWLEWIETRRIARIQERIAHLQTDIRALETCL
jgi:hydrogenase nickel incorporation protein HypB